MPQWLLDALGDLTVVQVLAWLAVVAGIIVAVKKLWPGLRALVRLADMLESLDGLMSTLQATPQFQKTTTATIERLRAQVENSHNTNLRDELTEALNLAKKTAESVEGLHGRVDQLEQTTSGQTAILEDVQGKLTRDHDRLTEIEDSIPRSELPKITKKEKPE